MHKKENRPENLKMSGRVLPRVPEMAITTGLIKAVILVFTCVLFLSTNLFAQKVKANDTIHWYNNTLERIGQEKVLNPKKDAVWTHYYLPDKVQKVLWRVLPELKVYIRYAPIFPSSKDYLFKMTDTAFREFDENYLRCLLYKSFHEGKTSAEDIVLTWFYINEMPYLMENMYVLDNVRIDKHESFQIEGKDYNYEISYQHMFNHRSNCVYRTLKVFYYIVDGDFIQAYNNFTFPTRSWDSKPNKTYQSYYKFPAKRDRVDTRDNKSSSSGYLLSCIDIQNSSFYQQFLGYHYFMVTNNGYPTNVQCMFLAQGLPNSSNNYRLKVISDGLFYSRRTIFESNLTYSAAQDGFISQVFLPEDNQYDGFFSVEVFNGDGTPVAVFPADSSGFISHPCGALTARELYGL
ncbi:MAG: hypothetical protein CVU06_03600 [Bacteroidetes bacterium HGW-Bacteroidetes-22]|nr:MAG: hypothetical protein CVU06_03600 [Bacteroidetes bacterium HGW-Bacteroidetes-22]